jgi:hypothetical protein
MVVLEKIEGSCTCKESNYYSLVVRPVAFIVPNELPCIIPGNEVSLCSDIYKDKTYLGLL